MFYRKYQVSHHCSNAARASVYFHRFNLFVSKDLCIHFHVELPTSSCTSWMVLSFMPTPSIVFIEMLVVAFTVETIGTGYWYYDSQVNQMFGVGITLPREDI